LPDVFNGFLRELASQVEKRPQPNPYPFSRVSNAAFFWVYSLAELSAVRDKVGSRRLQQWQRG
jgi:hypothetical protein